MTQFSTLTTEAYHKFQTMPTIFYKKADAICPAEKSATNIQFI